MRFVSSALGEVLKPLDRRAMRRVVSVHGGDHGVGSGPKAWTCERHMKALLFAQLAGLNSLREIEQGLSARPGSLYHLGLRMARRSTLGDALANRPSAVFRDVAQMLMADTSRAVRREAGELVRLIDATSIPLRDPRFGWAEADARVTGLKLHLAYDPRDQLLDWMEVTSPKVSDIAAAREMPVEPGVMHVCDKGYHDYGWWHRLHEGGAFFVTRLKINSKRREVEALPPHGEGILEDNRLKLGQRVPRGGARNPLHDTLLREVVVAREGKPPLRLVTNDLARPAEEIAALYKERWQIELLFKWLKQNLKIKRFLGRSENAVKTQIYVALIAFLLLRMLRQSAASAFKGSAKLLATRIGIALFSPLDLTDRAKPPPRQPATLPPQPQLQLALGGL